MIQTFPHQLQVSENIGSVSGESVIPADMKSIFTLAHGAGAGMNHAFMKKISTALAEKNIGTFRFNFPFIEKKKKFVDPPAVAGLTVRRAIEFVSATYAGVPVFASGKSFGGRMSSQLLSKNHDTSVKGLIFFGFPLHPEGSPSVARAEHLQLIKIPMLFLQGTHDSLASLPLIQEVTSRLDATTLSLLQGADHSFKSGKQDFIVELAEKASGWCDFFI